MWSLMPASGAAAGQTGQTALPDPRLKPAAHEFEACLMKEFLQPLQRDALFEDNDSGKSDNDSGNADGNALLSFGAESLARAISDRGGFGIADKIIGHFEKKATTPAKANGGG